MRATTPDVQHAQEGEQPPRGVEVDLDLVRELIPQQLRALVVQAAAADVDRLDARRARRADGGVVALADQEIVAHDAAEALQRHREPVELPALDGANLHDEAALLEADLQVEWTLVSRRGREAVLLEKIEDRHRALVLDIGGAAHHAALVEVDLDDPLRAQGRLRLTAREDRAGAPPRARARPALPREPT